jgi:Fe-S cluster biosynthesis and repair protein YggX
MKMARAPFRNAVGAWMLENISKQTFDEWIGLGTKIINELRLDLSKDEHEAVYDFAMRRFLGLGDDTYRELMGKNPPVPSEEYQRTVETVLAKSGQLESFQGDLHKAVGR